VTAQEQQSQNRVADSGHRPEGYRNTIIAATCLGLVWFGDTVIYVVLPLYALAFGFDALTIGVLLSVNRVVSHSGLWMGCADGAGLWVECYWTARGLRGRPRYRHSLYGLLSGS